MSGWVRGWVGGWVSRGESEGWAFGELGAGGKDSEG